MSDVKKSVKKYSIFANTNEEREMEEGKKYHVSYCDPVDNIHKYECFDTQDEVQDYINYTKKRYLEATGKVLSKDVNYDVYCGIKWDISYVPVKETTVTV